MSFWQNDLTSLTLLIKIKFNCKLYLPILKLVFEKPFAQVYDQVFNFSNR